MRYFGQQNEVDSPCRETTRDETRDVGGVRRAFESAYRNALQPEAAGRRCRGGELAPDRAAAPRPRAKHTRARRSTGEAKTTRKAALRGRGDVDTPVYDRRGSARGQSINGPAIIEERETTIIILPGWRANVDATGCVMASKE